MTDLFIPDPNGPQRVPDGQVGEFYFWLGSDEEISDLGDVDEPEFDIFGDDNGTDD